MRSFEMRLAAVVLAIALTYVYPPTATDGNAVAPQGETPSETIASVGGGECLRCGQ